MSGISTTIHTTHYAAKVAQRRAIAEPAWVRWSLTVLALAFLGLFLFIPLAAVLTEALRKGWETYVAAMIEPDALSAIKLTLTAAAFAVPLNLGVGIVTGATVDVSGGMLMR